MAQLSLALLTLLRFYSLFSGEVALMKKLSLVGAAIDPVKKNTIRLNGISMYFREGYEDMLQACR